MNRRETLSQVASVAAAAGLTAEVQAVESEPKPLFFVLSAPKGWLTTSEARRKIQEDWKAAFKDDPPGPLFILPEEVTIRPVTQTPAVCAVCGAKAES